MGESVLLAGDLNAKNTLWHCNSTNGRGAALEGCLDEIEMSILAPSEPTHFSSNDSFRPDILDIALERNVRLGVRSMRVLHELDSDHRPVILDLVSSNGPTDTGLNEPLKVKTNWRLLDTKLADTSSPDITAIPSTIVTPEETTLAIRSFTRHLQNVLSESSERVPETLHSRWQLPDDVRWVVRRRNAALKASAIRPTPERRSLARYLQREAKRRIKEVVDSRWENRLTELEPTHQAFWQLSRSFRRNDVTTMPPLNRPNQRPALDDDEKAEHLADSLESQCSLPTLPFDHEHLVAVNTLVESRNAIPPTPLPRPIPTDNIDPDVELTADPLTPVTIEEVTALIKALKKRKAPGGDGIPTRLVKMLPEHLVKILADIYNAAFSNRLFPAAWKEATVIGIHKPGKPATESTSYRPISLLSTLGKMYERIVLDRLKTVAYLHQLLPAEQFGFREKHSCVHQVLRITEYVHDKFRLGMPTGAIFFDIEKAFDKVWHNGLLYKLYTLNVPTHLVHIIREFLSNRGFRYRVEGSLSSRHTITAGVPQGSALSPFLFSLYTSDIPKPKNAHLALFADDTAIYASHRDPRKVTRTLQTAADNLGKWFNKWRITINPSKSQAILFTRKRKSQAPHATVKMANVPIPWTNQAKYLGVILDQSLTFIPHVNAVRARAAFAMGQLHWLINKNSPMAIRNKIRLYTTCIRPIMTYASPAFAHIPPARLQRMQVLQNKFLRRALGAPWFVRNRNLHVDMSLPTIRHFMQLASKRYFEKAEQHSNTLIRQASIYKPIDRAKHRRPRSTLTDPEDEITLAIKDRTEFLKLIHSTRPQFRPRRRGPRRVPRPPDPSPVPARVPMN